jgi:hypothetical protein
MGALWNGAAKEVALIHFNDERDFGLGPVSFNRYNFRLSVRKQRLTLLYAEYV